MLLLSFTCVINHTSDDACIYYKYSTYGILENIFSANTFVYHDLNADFESTVVVPVFLSEALHNLQ